MKIFVSSLKSSLRNTRDKLSNSLKTLIPKRRGLSEDFLEEIEQTLILGDIGVESASLIIEELRERFQKEKDVGYDEIIGVIKEIIQSQIHSIEGEKSAEQIANSPMVVFVVGVNGTGKTTSIGKLAYYYKEQGKKVLLVAADTFRAAAVDQLEKWKDRTGTDIIKNIEGTDPAAVVFDSAKAAIARNIDVMLIDTAGRIHTNKNLMRELEKIARVIGNIIPGAPHKTLLVIDANMGQNSISQARSFADALNISGIILTKLDGTAKGGVVVPIMKDLKIPIEFVGTGEQKEDIEVFDAQDYVNALFTN